jgi:hypothetical protein
MIASISRVLVDRFRAAWSSRGRTFRALTPDVGREVCCQLQAQKQALHNFTIAMEQEFLELGALLRQITSLARQVRDRSDKAIAAASGRAEDAAIQFAFQLLKKAEDLVQASREQHHNVFAVFEKMHLDLIKIARERSVLQRMLSPLETATTQFRIQACAFDENTRAQFFALADAIGEIVKDVRAAVGQRFEELERTGQATGELAAKLAAIAAEQKLETENMLAESRDQLSKLNEVLLASESVAQSISQAGTNIATGVGKVIVALQCQDMARQKFEHISAAIDEMIGHLKTVVMRGLSGAEAIDCRRFLADASRVQLSQLQSVFEQLNEAASQAGEGLQEVKLEAKSLADHAVRCGDATLDGQIIEQAVRSIHAVLAVIDNAVANVKSVTAVVQKLKSTFSDCTSQILGLALRLRMVALNAQILAAHVDAGTALEVVAKNTRTIADQAMQQLDEISSRVVALVDLVVDLEQRLADHHDLADMERNLLAGEAGESEQKLGTLELELRNAVAAIRPLEQELSGTIRRVTECIRFPEAVAQASARSTALFEQIVIQNSDTRGKHDMSAHHKVQELKRNYTMAHERNVHAFAVESGLALEKAVRPFEIGPEPANTVGPSGEPDQPPAAHRITVEEDDLADNVELF